MEFLYKFCYGLTTLSGIGLGLLVLAKNPRSRVNVTWALTSFAVAIWATEGFTHFFGMDYDRALFQARLCNYAAMFIPVFFTHFCLALLNKPLRESRMAIAGYLFAIGMSAFVLTPWFIPSVSPKVIFLHYANPGPLYVAYTIQFFTLVIYSHVLLFRHLHRQPRDRQNQIKYVALATIIGFTCGSTSFLPVYNIPFNPIPSLFTTIYAVIITYAIVKHHLMDIRIVIRRSVVYSALIAIITAIYLVAVLVMERGFQGFFGYRSLVATVIVAFLIAIFFNPLRTRIQAFVDRALFKATPAELVAQRERLLTEVRRGEQMKAVGTLAAGLAHEIKNPLASIKTFTEHLNSHHADPRFRAKFQKIVGGEVERIHLIVQQLLEFAKPTPPKLQPVALPQLLDETLEFLNSELVSHHVEVTRHYDRAGKILGDPQQLKQVFLNLFLNSLHAMNGYGRLEIQTIAKEAELAVTIADTGTGITPKDLPHVFEPFYTTKPTGTGLGLAIVQSIIQEHSGRVQIASHPGQGTQITLSLPLAV